AAPSWSGDLTGNGRPTKSGVYAQVLGGANTSTGGPVVAAGALQLGSATALGAANATLNLNTSGAVVDLHGFNATVGALAGASGTQIRNDATGTNLALTVGAGNTSNTFSGTIADHSSGSGTVSLVKIGNGTET